MREDLTFLLSLFSALIYFCVFYIFKNTSKVSRNVNMQLAANREDRVANSYYNSLPYASTAGRSNF